MRRFAALPLFVAAVPALAHPSHIAEQAGHTHWFALAALAAALAVGVGAVAAIILRRRKVALSD